MNKPHKHAALIHAWADGAEIEYKYPNENSWIGIEQYPYWDINTQYRIKPATQLKVAIEALEKFANNPYYPVIVSAEAIRILHEIRSME